MLITRSNTESRNLFRIRSLLLALRANLRQITLCKMVVNGGGQNQLVIQHRGGEASAKVSDIPFQPTSLIKKGS